MCIELFTQHDSFFSAFCRSTKMLRSFYSHTYQGKHGYLEVNHEGIYLQHDED
ncbi:hypothetical protein Hanom_Chr14g01298001 [Helianthus anomalus]